MSHQEKKKENYLNFSFAGRDLIVCECRKRGFVSTLYFPGSFAIFTIFNIHKLIQIFSHTVCEAGSSSQAAKLPERQFRNTVVTRTSNKAYLFLHEYVDECVVTPTATGESCFFGGWK